MSDVIGPIELRRAHALIAHPERWGLGGALIWRNVQTGERITDQLVDAVRTGKV